MHDILRYGFFSIFRKETWYEINGRHLCGNDIVLLGFVETQCGSYYGITGCQYPANERQKMEAIENHSVSYSQSFVTVCKGNTFPNA
jgi:hypothetical protein